ncbi:MarR family winged helix-turn-helix transcriptional regulator [Cryptosporangium sp. NPDC051539]|uniref:MarR family winged helix-turn-helix transcriptional regulator n=1 Tax=Cryptosporangium sp. NPDC051539 TaxID=3363962 RepID=UPI0037A9AD4C
MSRNAEWLDPGQQRTWLAYMRVMLRLNYEMNRQLLADSDLSLSDYDVLNALSEAPGRRLRITALAALIGWERSRLSHHLQRMATRGLIERAASTEDRRATDAVLTEAGRAVLTGAAPGHVALVRRMFFDGVDPALVPGLTTALEQIHTQLLATGSLPRPAADQPENFA